jgi:hypothetical protein
MVHGCSKKTAYFNPKRRNHLTSALHNNLGTVYLSQSITVSSDQCRAVSNIEPVIYDSEQDIMEDGTFAMDDKYQPWPSGSEDTSAEKQLRKSFVIYVCSLTSSVTMS